MPTMLPALFLSHGAPTLAIEPSAAREFLVALGPDLDRRFGRPRAVLIASAHWETPSPRLTGAAAPRTIHDFGGFPDELFRMRYPAAGAVDVAREARDRLVRAGFEAELDPERGLDHGAWVPLSLLYPGADVPVAQLSVQPHLGAAHHLAVGRALAPLRAAGVLIVGSGGITHNLTELFASRQLGAEMPHVTEFVEWIAERAEAGEIDRLADYRQAAPHAVRNHPTDEHLLPLFVALGAATPGAPVRRIHESATFGSVRMDSFEMA
jgi:4,5-DOPA dioxygenase extradiol